MQPLVAVVFTGGTLSMRVAPGAAGPVPVMPGAEILGLVPGLTGLARVRPVDFALLPGPHMTPARMVTLAGVVAEQRADPAIAGVVVTHGTDTLEESAFLLDLILPPGKPVVFTGAMRNSSEPGWDGPANLHAAVRVAADPAATGLGGLVVFNARVLAAADAVKTSTSSVDTFQGGAGGPLGWVEPDGVAWCRRPVRAPEVTVPAGAVNLESRVELVTLPAGDEGRLVDAALASGARGLVLQGVGRGNVPITALPAVRRALATGQPVVITTRCHGGRVLDTYAYEGAGQELRAAGAILGGFLPAHKARLKLMLLLGAGADREAVRAAFADRP